MSRPFTRALCLGVITLTSLSACVVDGVVSNGQTAGDTTGAAPDTTAGADTGATSADTAMVGNDSAAIGSDTSPIDSTPPDDTVTIVDVAPTAIAATLDGTPTSPQIAVNAVGDAVAAWVQQRSTMPAYAIYASRVTPDGWSAPAVVATWSASMPHDLALAQNDSGDALVAWSSGSIHASRFDATAGRWSAPFEVAPPPPAPAGGYSVGPEIALSGHGDALVMWAAGRYNTQEIVLSARAQDATGAWHAAIEFARGDVELTTSGSGAAFDVTANAEGQAVAAWTTKLGDTRQVWVRRAERGSAARGPWDWRAAQLVAQVESWNGAIWAEIDQSGSAFVAWAAADSDLQNGDIRWSIAGVRAGHGMAFGAPESIVAGIPGSFGFESIAPELAADPAGGLLFAWREGLRPVDFAHPEPSRILAKRFQPGSGWAETEVVADALAPPYFGCAMPGTSAFAAVLSGDTSAVVWQERAPDGAEAAVQIRASHGHARWSDTAVLAHGAPSWSRDLTVSLGGEPQGHTGFALWTEAGPDPVNGAWTTTLWATPLALAAP